MNMLCDDLGRRGAGGAISPRKSVKRVMSDEPPSLYCAGTKLLLGAALLSGLGGGLISELRSAARASTLWKGLHRY